MKTFDWMSNPQYLAQVGHFLGGACLLLATALLFGFMPACPIAFTIGLFAAGFKEFIFDTASWGEGNSWADSAMDFAFYVAGGLAGFGVAALAHHLGRC